MQKLLKALGWVDNNILKILIAGLIFIIPLYPKFPLLGITYTYVAVRLEDVFIGILVLVFCIQLIRKKVVLNKTFLKYFLVFWGAIFVSFFLSVYVFQTLPYRQVALLHTLRRIEYMIIFFIITSSITSKKDFLNYIKLVMFVFGIVCIYGAGQKFLGWPAVQTMNPEYAKGYLLFLTEDARISSTFSGHYDLAAYLVFLMPVALGFYFAFRNYLYYLIFIIALFALVLTAARSSFAAYIVTIIGFLLMVRKPKHLLFILALTGVFTFLNKSLSSRIARTFQVKQIFVNDTTGQVIVPQRISTKEVPAGSFYFTLKNKGSGPTTDESNLANEKIRSEIRDQYAKEGKVLTGAEETRLAASISAGLKPINTVVSDISFATRLQVEWPRAIAAFISNPFFGTGASSITEATDNDFLRTLGEFGLAGFLSFGAILFVISKKIWAKARLKNENARYYYMGFLFGLAALLINATYIDVFEASKVAYTFWIVAALFIGLVL